MTRAAMTERLVVATLAERPDLRHKVFGPEIQTAMPEFVRHDPTAALYYADAALSRYLEYGLVAVDLDEPDRPVARAFCVPFAFRDVPGRPDLPDGGWDAVIRWAHEDHVEARRPNAVSALEIMVAPRLARQGISRTMLTAMRGNIRRLGYLELWAPLRPTAKEREPATPFAEYSSRRRENGLPFDPWVRTHVRAGAEIVKVAARSVVIPGRLAEWRRWTGLPFDKSGPAVVLGALVPVHVSLEQDHAVYVEPNLWVRHPLD